MGYPDVFRKSVFIDGESVVLAGNHNSAALQILNRMVGTVVTEFHLHGSGTGGKTEQLVAQTDPEGRNALIHYFSDCVDSVVARLRIARSV